MPNLDKTQFSNFAVDPEFENIYEYDELYDFDFNGNSDKPQDDIDFDDSDEFIWDDD